MKSIRMKLPTHFDVIEDEEMIETIKEGNYIIIAFPIKGAFKLMNKQNFLDWLITQSVGYDIWDRKEEKLYALPLWLAIKKDEYNSLERGKHTLNSGREKFK